jgi:hypothetical protein
MSSTKGQEFEVSGNSPPALVTDVLFIEDVAGILRTARSPIERQGQTGGAQQ